MSEPLKADPLCDPVDSLLNTIANKLADAIEERDWKEVERIEDLCRKGLPGETK